MSEASTLSRYYDRLALWSRVAGLLGRDGGLGALTVHRALADPRTGGRPTTRRVHDLLRAQLPVRRPLVVLDAGCGYGGTMLDLARDIDGRFHGLTLSRRQAEIGRRAARRRGLAARVDLECRSYDAPPDAPVDAILAIESLAHSADPAASVAALARLLRPGGRLLVVDDMPEPAAAASPDLAVFKRGWRCPVLWSRADYAAAFERLGLALVVDQDLSAALRLRGDAAIARLVRLNRLAHRLVAHDGWRMVMDSHLGGLALERLHRRGLMRYRLLAGERR
ncbi:MAG: methyltransferase domain-containing protein [Alphaproteobacteria bacterium]|nr:methyltransferase domain-containing protein [Alphaproteobacteria bacterium]